MHYDDFIYRPPTEEDTTLLQVTSGCSHNKCTYCNMYEGVSFKCSPIEDVEEDLKQIRDKEPYTKRLFLLNGDPFSLEFQKLKEIMLLIKKYLPYCETVTTYASVNSMKNKTVDELKELRRLGINHLYIGVETGHNEILKFIKKESTTEDAEEQLKKLNDAKIDFIAIVMYGIAGAGKGKENAKATATLMNKVKMAGIGPMNLNILRGTSLHKQVEKGEFREASDVEKLIELRTLVEELNQKEEMLFACIHMSNLLNLQGVLPTDRERFLTEINTLIESLENNEIYFEKTENFGTNI